MKVRDRGAPDCKTLIRLDNRTELILAGFQQYSPTMSGKKLSTELGNVYDQKRSILAPKGWKNIILKIPSFQPRVF